MTWVLAPAGRRGQAMIVASFTEAVFHEDSYDDAETLMLPTSVIAVIT
jgi:hypothetical protein